MDERTNEKPTLKINKLWKERTNKMTREKFVKYKIKAYQKVYYQSQREGLIECMLVGLNYDEEILTLCPIDPEYEKRDFQAHISHCEFYKNSNLTIKRSG